LGDTHANAVIYSEGSLYYAAGDGNGGIRLDLSDDGSEVSEVWHNPRFDSFMGGIVKQGDFLYTSGTVSRNLMAIDGRTGTLSDSLKIGHGALIAADSMLYYYNQQGIMYLLHAREGKLKEVSSFRFRQGTGQHFAHPVIYRGVLYQRRGQALVAYRLKA
jgi:hypothetical protein